MKNLNGKFRVEVKSDSPIGREWISIAPKDVQVVKTLINIHTDEEIQLVFCYGNSEPYTVYMSHEDYAEMSNGVDDGEE